MSKIAPLVTIVVPSFNHDNYLEKCINSIVNQTYNNFELIVIDDGSKDRSREILIQLREKYNFELVFQENLGLANTLNRGFKELAKGKYLTFCASDDYWLPEKLQKQVEYMESNPEYGMVYGKALMVDTDNNILEVETNSNNSELRGGNIFKDLILLNFHPPVNYLFRADVLKEMGYYRPDIWAEDFDMNLRIALKYPIGFINEFISAYMVSDSQTLSTKYLTFKTVNSHLNSINLFKESPFYKEAITQWHYRCFKAYCGRKRTKAFAFKCMIKSINQFYKLEFLNSFVVLFLKWK